LREAADVLEAVRDHVVVIGAAAVQVALDGEQVALTPTRDVDVGIAGEDAERVVAHLHARGMRRSGLPHEHSFTWVKDDLKVQLVRPSYSKWYSTAVFPAGSMLPLSIVSV